MAPQLVGGRRAGARVQEPRTRRRAVPGRGQALRVHGSRPAERRELGDAGRRRVKTNRSAAAPFVASYGGYAATACVETASGGSVPTNASSPPGDADAWMDRQLGPECVAWARENYMI